MNWITDLENAESQGGSNGDIGNVYRSAQFFELNTKNGSCKIQIRFCTCLKNYAFLDDATGAFDPARDSTFSRPVS